MFLLRHVCATRFFYVRCVQHVSSMSGLYNLLDMPAGTVPVGSVTEDDDRQFAAIKVDAMDPLSKLMRGRFDGWMNVKLFLPFVNYLRSDPFSLIQTL